MFLSTGFGRGDRGEGLPVLQHCPEHVDAAPRESDDGLVMAFALLPLAYVEGLALRATLNRPGFSGELRV